VDALAAALAAALLCAGLTKLAVPAATRAALTELVPVTAGMAGLAVSTLAVAESASAVALLNPASRPAGAAGATLLGVLFTVAGLAGHARHATAPCGCYLSSGGPPLGTRNVVVGLLVAAMGVAAWWLSGRSAATDPARLASLTAILMCLLAAALHRRLILAALRPAITPASAGETTEGAGW
jgi:hypothetical protein